jgi:hypothetical protein
VDGALGRAERPRGSGLNTSRNHALEFANAHLITLIKGPLLDALASEQLRLDQDLEVFTGGGLADAQLSRDRQAANAIGKQIPGYLRRKMPFRLPQPSHDLKAPLIRKCAQREFQIHIARFI